MILALIRLNFYRAMAMSDLADWLQQVPQLSARAVEAREAYLRWIREQQQAAIDAHKAEQRTGDEAV